jgi:hypothetical protein
MLTGYKKRSIAKMESLRNLDNLGPFITDHPIMQGKPAHEVAACGEAWG